jgi:hypothetical protein
MAWAFAATIPYLAIRLLLSRFVLEDGTANLALFTWEEAQRWLPLAPEAWWLSFRAAWIFILAWIILVARNGTRFSTAITVLTLIATISLTVCLAHDLTRSTGVVWPTLVAGSILLGRNASSRLEWIVPAVTLLNALLPTGHVVDKWTLWIWPFGA